MSNKRVKNVGYDDDDFEDDYDDDYADGEGAGEVSDEDKKQLAAGTVKVRQVLGDSAWISDQQIQESLWHYYYDVDKTVNYILTQRDAAAAREAKQAAQQAKRAATNSQSAPTYSYPFPAVLPAQDDSGLFDDCPWRRIPEWRRADILVIPVHPPGRLLGGSGAGGPKKSKLAALAAARRKGNSTTAAPEAGAVNASVALLDKLSLQKDQSNDATAKRPSDRPLTESPRPRKYPVRQRQNEPEPEPAPAPEEIESPQLPPEDSTPAQIASPSAFAGVLAGPAGKPEAPQSVGDPPTSYPPYRIPTEFPANPFQGPSPDDIVSQAQSGSKALNKNIPKK